MKMKARWNRALQLALGMLLAATLGFAPQAQADTKVRFSLDWSPGSYHTPFLIALYKGYYKAEGLDVTIDRGKGSAQLVRQLAAGVYDMGHPDLNVVIDFDARNPDAAFPMVMVGYEQYPSGIFTLKKSNINEPRQLEGKTLGPAVNDSTFKLWPLFAQLAHIDASKVEVTYLDPSVREAMLAQGKVDAITGQVFRSMLDLNARGVPNDQIVKFMYQDYGLDLYGNGVAVSKSFMKAHPEAVKGFLRATIKGVKDMIADPDMAIDMLIRFEPLLDAKIERRRLDLALDCCILTKNVKARGYGDVDPERLERSITQIYTAYELPRKPEPKEVFDDSFLPPVQDRKVD